MTKTITEAFNLAQHIRGLGFVVKLRESGANDAWPLTPDYAINERDDS